jgi:hypothetical protein
MIVIMAARRLFPKRFNLNYRFPLPCNDRREFLDMAIMWSWRAFNAWLTHLISDLVPIFIFNSM